VSHHGDYVLLSFSEGSPGPSRVDVRDSKDLTILCSVEGYSLAHSIPNGDLMAAGRSQVEVLRLPDCSYVRTLSDSWFENDFSVSPDGALLAAPHEQSLRIWSIASGKVLGEVPIQGGGAHNIEFSPDGMWIADGWRSSNSDESEVRFFAIVAP
jgi:WD40 repeat protein